MGKNYADFGKPSVDFGKYSVRSSGEVSGRVVDFLRRHHPLKTADAVAAETAIAASTVAKWLDGSIVPGGVSLLRLIATYGPEFLCAVMGQSPDWLTAAARGARQAQLEAEHARLAREIARLQR